MERTPRVPARWTRHRRCGADGALEQGMNLDMKRLRITAASFVFLSTLLLSTSHVTAAELRKITFGYSSIGPMMHGLWMAKEIGAFEKYGLEAQLVFIASGPVVIQALLGGDLHAGLAATSAVIGAAAKGAALKNDKA